MKPTITELLDLKHCPCPEAFEAYEYPWEILKDIKDIIIKLGKQLPAEEYDELSENVWVAKNAKVFPSAYLGAPCIIGQGSEVRHGAFIRGAALVGSDCVIGNSVELKNVILFDNVQVPHYNYVGDSILGYKAHMGAGSITSNVKADRGEIVVHGSENYQTGLKKMGAILGDYAEIGCNAVLNPGTIVGPHSNIYPLTCVRGIVPSFSILKNDGSLVKKNKDQYI